LDGTWQVDSLCVQGDIAAMNANSGLPAACSTLFQSSSYAASGTVSYANGVQTSDITVIINMQVLYTQACVSAQNGVTAVLNDSVCASVQQSLISSGNFTSATCAFSNEGCRCALSSQSTDTSVAQYTISGNSIVFTNGDAPLEYCVSGRSLTISQVSGGETTVSHFHHS
jgi:hypothetical protein